MSYSTMLRNTLGDIIKPGGAMSYRDVFRNKQVILKKAGNRAFSPGGDRYEARMELAARIREVAEDGMVLVFESGYDCDWTYSAGGNLVPAVTVAVERLINLIYEGAEGPTSVEILRPSDAPEGAHPNGYNAVEAAHEDGHPHVVYI